MDASRLRRRRIIVLVLFLSVSGALGTGFVRGLYRAQKQPDRKTELLGDLPTPPTKPRPASQGFVGSQVCAECHEEIAAKYARHPMGRSLNTVADSDVIESYEDTEFAPPGPRRYRVTRTEQGVTHHETMVDPEGNVIYDQAVPVRFVLGSGQHGRSYLIEKEGMLWQSSIGWFTQGKKWGLSPGYAPDLHLRFERRVGNGCLYCHAGRVKMAGDGGERYAEPVFEEMSIGCERCHGPGKAHVEKQRSGRQQGVDATIVNPIRLDPSRREAVCNQCHLQGEKTLLRYGRSFFDYRPGEPLEDTLLLFVHGERVDEQRQTRPVSQVEQMRSSACFKKSQGKMGCTSCHDPHDKPAPEQERAYYQEKCTQCHQNQGCSLPADQRDAAPANGSCVHCHMPRLFTKDVAHTSLTDHRVLRRAERASSPRAPVPPDQLELFDNAADRLDRRELDRARGLALMEAASVGKDQLLAARARDYLVPAGATGGGLTRLFVALGDDVQVLEALGQCMEITEDPELAVEIWQHAMQLQPRNESLAARLAFAYQTGEQWEPALRYLDRAIELNPYSSIYYGRRAHVLGQLGRLDEGVAAAEKALELDPTLTQVREWLIDIYRRLGNEDKADAQRKMLERMPKPAVP